MTRTAFSQLFVPVVHFEYGWWTHRGLPEADDGVRGRMPGQQPAGRRLTLAATI